MSKSNLHARSQPEVASNDPLHELIRQGARELISKAVESELQGLLDQYADASTPDGRQAVVRNGYLPKRTVQTGVGDVDVQVPKVRDRSGSGIRFNSHLLPPYLKRARSLDELIPWLYLRGVSSGDFQEALSALVGEQAKGLSANMVSDSRRSGLRSTGTGKDATCARSAMSTGGPMACTAMSAWMTGFASW